MIRWDKSSEFAAIRARYSGLMREEEEPQRVERIQHYQPPYQSQPPSPPPPQDQSPSTEDLLKQLTRLFFAHVKITESSLNRLGRLIGQLSEYVAMIAEQQARAQVCEQVAPPLATVEAVSIHTEDEEVEVCAEEIPVEEDEEKDVEETPLQVLAPIAQSADCGEPGKISSFSFPSNTLCRTVEGMLGSYDPGDLTITAARARPRFDSRDRGRPPDQSKYGGVRGRIEKKVGRPAVLSGLRFKPFQEWFHFEVVHTAGLRGSKEYG